MDIHNIQPRDEEGRFLPMKYVAVVGLNYRAKSDGSEIRVEAGEEVLDLADNAIAAELRAGNIAVAPEDDGLGLEPVGLVDVTEYETGELEQDGEVP